MAYLYGDGAYGASGARYGTFSQFALSDFTITCGVDWSSTSGPLTDAIAYSNVSADVLVNRGITLRHGRAPESARADSGSATWTLSNGSGKYTPEWEGTSALTLYSQTFETGTHTWSSVVPTVTTAVSADTAHSGTKSLKMTASAGGLSAAYPAAVNLGGASAVTFTAWVRATASRRCSLAVAFTSGASIITRTSDPVTVADEWTLLRLSAVVPSGYTSATIAAQWVASGAGDVLYVDDVALDARPSPTIGRPVRWQITPPGGTPTTVWSGSISEYRTARESGSLGTTQVQAVDLISSLSALELDEVMASDIRRTGAAVYFPLDEADTTGASDAISGQRLLAVQPNQHGAGGSVAIAQRWDGYGAIQFNGNATDDHGYWLQADAPAAALAPLASASALTWEMFVKVTSAGNSSLFYAGTSTYGIQLRVEEASDYAPTVRVFDDAAGVLDVVGPAGLPDWSHIAITQKVVGSDLVVELYINGVLGGTGTLATSGRLLNPAVDTTIFGIGDYLALTSPALTGSIAHFAVHASALPAATLATRTFLRSGDTRTDPAVTIDSARERFSRLTALAAGSAGVAASKYAQAADGASTAAVASYTGDSTVWQQSDPEPLQPLADIRGKSLFDALTDPVSTSGGVLYASPTGQLLFADVTSTYTTSPALTLDARTALDPQSVTANLSTQSLANDVTVTQTGGAVSRTQDNASIETFGRKTLSATTASRRYSHAYELASWLLALNSSPRLATPELTINVVGYVNSGGSFGALAALTVGALVRVTNLPTEAPASSIDLLVDAVEWKIGANQMDVTLSISPALPFTVARLDASQSLGSGIRLGL